MLSVSAPLRSPAQPRSSVPPWWSLAPLWGSLVPSTLQCWSSVPPQSPGPPPPLGPIPSSLPLFHLPFGLCLWSLRGSVLLRIRALVFLPFTISGLHHIKTIPYWTPFPKIPSPGTDHRLTVLHTDRHIAES